MGRNKNKDILHYYMEPWTKKYQPNNLDEMEGNQEVYGKLQRLVKTSNSSSKGIFLEGPYGSGKTSAVYALAQQEELEVVEINASDTRKKKAVTSLLSNVIGQQSLFAKGKIVLVDEIEGLSGRSDRGGVSAVAKIIDKSPYPVIVTGIDAQNRKYKKIKKKTIILELKKLKPAQIANRLRQIFSKENIEYKERDIKQLARTAGGDMRAALNDAQASIVDNTFVYSEEIASSRDVDLDMENALTRIFKTTNAETALGAYDNVQQTLDKIFLWLDKNLYREYTKPEDLKNAYEDLSYADILFGRIRRRQYYRFYSYCYQLLSAGIALSKKQPYRKRSTFKEPDRPLKIWIYNRKTGKEKSIAEKLATYTHISQYESRIRVLPFLKTVAKKQKGFAKWLEKEIELEPKETKWLLK